MPDDNHLLHLFAQDRSEAAFGELVQRHIELVYAAALRVVNGDPPCPGYYPNRFHRLGAQIPEPARDSALRLQTNQLAAELAESRQRAQALLQSWDHSRLTEHNRIIESAYQGVQTGATGKLGDAAKLAAAFINYAAAHSGEIPLDMGRVAQFLTEKMDPDANRWGVLAITNGFEIVYQGSLRDLAGAPRYPVALLREAHPLLTPDGRRSRVYAYADGSANTVASDDDFQSWEARHIVPPEPPGQ